jgi:hypothetical protein
MDSFFHPMAKKAIQQNLSITGLESHPDEAIQKHFSTNGFYSQSV